MNNTGEKMIENTMDRNVVMTLSAFFGFTGLDRLYMKCYVTGMMKLLLFVLYLSIGAIGNNTVRGIKNIVEVKMLLSMIILVWYAYDVYKISFGAMNEIPYPTMCNKPTWEHTKYTKMYAIVIVAILTYLFYNWLFN